MTELLLGADTAYGMLGSLGAHLAPLMIARTEAQSEVRAFERYLARNGTLVLKFFLNVLPA